MNLLSNATKLNVLIVDDSEIIRSRLVDMLSDIKDIGVINQAENLKQAVSSIYRSSPNIIILDLQLPDGCGLELIDKIKTMQLNPVIIVFTNYTFPQYRKKSEDLGVKYFFDKSKEFTNVYELLKELINESRLS